MRWKSTRARPGRTGESQKAEGVKAQAGSRVHVILRWEQGFPGKLAIVKNRAYSCKVFLVTGRRIFPVAELLKYPAKQQLSGEGQKVFVRLCPHSGSGEPSFSQTSRGQFLRRLHPQEKTNKTYNTRCGRNDDRRPEGAMMSLRPEATMAVQQQGMCISQCSDNWEMSLRFYVTAGISQSAYVQSACPECRPRGRCVFCVGLYATAQATGPQAALNPECQASAWAELLWNPRPCEASESSCSFSSLGLNPDCNSQKQSPPFPPNWGFLIFG